MSEAGYKKKMLSVEQVEKSLIEIQELSKQEQISCLLVGGVALQYYGSDRFTADVDFVAPEALPGLTPETPLSFGGYQSHTPSGVPVDWIVRSDDYQELYEEALRNPRWIEGVPVPVVAPEYLLAMKMVARRRKDELDVETLLELGVVDTEKALKLVKRLLGAYAADDLRAHLQMAEWNRLRAKGEK